MKKWLVYVLGIITGVILTLVLAVCVNLSNNAGIIGLEMFKEPGENMGYTHLKVIQVFDSGCALAKAGDSMDAIVFLLSDDGQKFYDNQKIVLGNNQCALRVGTYRYTTAGGMERTVPAVEIVDGAQLDSNNPVADKDNSGKTFFDEPGECVSRKNFEVQKVLESGDAIALEIREILSGHVLTSDLAVLIPADEGNSFYEKQIVKAPRGKCARQIGVYKYESEYGGPKVIPIIAFQ